MFRGLSVYTGNAHPAFARDICRHLEIPLGQAEVFKFANDEIFVKINENAREHDVFIVQSLVGPSVSDAIMELLIMIDAFKRAS
ncbi:MAG TPA: ribose-phosphate pyrophosphokinase-like domain-containing protein, partial [Candidatus Limnocylindria bacterium]